jgi:feruloyl esterase
MRLRILLTAAPMLLFCGFGAAQTLNCTGLLQTPVQTLPNRTTAIRSAKPLPAQTAQGNTPAFPAHCEVIGALNERTGTNGQKYAIKFHLRLPDAWNGKFFFEGGGGSNGNLGAAFGNLQGQQRTNALSLGYAVVSQDSGHDNAVNNDPERGGTTTFGFDEQARLDFGYNSYDQVAQTAKALIRTYYGRPPERSYYAGCSEGGREAMMMSQRFPTYFDGILACAPGFQLQKAAVFGESWDTQAFAELAKSMGLYDRFGQPYLNKTLTDEDLDLVSQAVLNACDELDGLKDGIVDNFPACTRDLVKAKLAEVTCKGPKRATCLLASQITAIEKVYGGARNSKGELLYADWAWDRGMGGKIGDNYNGGWRVWKVGPYDVPTNSAINATLGAGSVATIFSTPPTAIQMNGPAGLAHLLAIDMDKAEARITAKSGEYTVSSNEFMSAGSTDLSAYKTHGGKLILVHGVSDPIFSIKDTIRWWNEVNNLNQGKAADFVRLFAVPGMNHCQGGPATDQYDAFGALVSWVEKNTPPAMIVATAGPASPWPGRTRPLCAYPQQSRYSGTGSVDSASSFLCK